jgi:L-alanine-DL-glutamate epimerase-like enolase superfamily enzyme
MKIVDLKVDVLHNPEFEVRGDASLETVIVRVFTDQGIVGFGDAGSSPKVVRSIIDAPTYFTLSRDVRELLIGRDPLEINLIWEELYRMTQWPGRRGAYLHAISAIDVALWDIMGKAFNQPIYKLLGGAFQKEVRGYASHVMPDTPKGCAELAAKAVSNGWPALKMGWFPYASDQEEDLAMVAAIRDGAGPKTKIMLDVGPRWDITTDGRPAVQLWDAKTAIQRIKSWERYEPCWVEEPLPADDLDGYRKLTTAVDTHIAAGETETTRFPLFDLMDRGNIDVVQLDVSRVGGLTEARRVTQAAYDRNRPWAPHCFSTGLCVTASVHLAAASPNYHHVEYTISESQLTNEIVHPRIEHKNGMLRVPEGPGLGVELNMDLINRLRLND